MALFQFLKTILALPLLIIVGFFLYFLPKERQNKIFNDFSSILINIGCFATILALLILYLEYYFFW